MTDTLHARSWTVERVVPLLAGVMVLASIAPTLAFSSWWLLLTAFVGANLLLFGAVGWCPASLLLHRLGVPRLAAPGPAPSGR
ncbi:DUF2892 domain-containing protein [Rhodococcus sp. ACS1]|uniref:Inner membrane protein YgaP-like transmembrane domain-containing protein n=1 Tax=Rhodococcus koreensis TaxID=99653 RepID=A0A1H5ETS6_9NOCA|nr:MULTISPECIES: DUF2892 domain-containing protein [Rhodococcus]PBC40104.1 DUF2892 domain-containing protein [Rhodococcus sp. ACS1]SED94388.1 Protein of unknown function [Rhodococcus koreensis]